MHAALRRRLLVLLDCHVRFSWSTHPRDGVACRRCRASSRHAARVGMDGCERQRQQQFVLDQRVRADRLGRQDHLVVRRFIERHQLGVVARQQHARLLLDRPRERLEAALAGQRQRAPSTSISSAGRPIVVCGPRDAPCHVAGPSPRRSDSLAASSCVRRAAPASASRARPSAAASTLRPRRDRAWPCVAADPGQRRILAFGRVAVKIRLQNKHLRLATAVSSRSQNMRANRPSPALVNAACAKTMVHASRPRHAARPFWCWRRRRATAASCWSGSACPSSSRRPTSTRRRSTGEAPAATALRLAEAKARAVAARHPDALVIGSDQVADCDGVAVGKPGDHATAMAQLAAQSGRTVVFHTGGRAARSRSGALQRRAGRRREHVPHARRARRSKPTSSARSPTIAPAACASEALGIALFERIDSDDPTALIGLPLIALSRHAARRRRRRARAPARDAGTLYLVPNLLGTVAARSRAAGAHDRRRARHRALGRRNAEGRARVPRDAGDAGADRAVVDRRRSPRRAPTPSSTRCSRPRATATTSACCPTPAARRRRSRCARRRGRAPRRHARGAAGGAFVDPAGADGVRHERPAVRVSRLPAAAPDARAAALRAPRGRIARRMRVRRSSSRRRTATSRCWSRSRARCAPTTRVCVAADLTLAERIGDRRCRHRRGAARDFAGYREAAGDVRAAGLSDADA